MKIFLAGENQKKHIISLVHREKHEAVFGRNREQTLDFREREREREVM